MGPHLDSPEFVCERKRVCGSSKHCWRNLFSRIPSDCPNSQRGFFRPSVFRREDLPSQRQLLFETMAHSSIHLSSIGSVVARGRGRSLQLVGKLDLHDRVRTHHSTRQQRDKLKQLHSFRLSCGMCVFDSELSLLRLNICGCNHAASNFGV